MDLVLFRELGVDRDGFEGGPKRWESATGVELWLWTSQDRDPIHGPYLVSSTSTCQARIQYLPRD